MFRRATIGLFALAFAASASADPRQELHEAFIHNLQLKSFRATMIDMASNKTVSTIEFQAPDRYRVAAGGQPASMIIGGTMYLNANGHMMKIPIPTKMLGKYRNEEAIADLEKNLTVESLGPGMVGTVPARKYRFINTGKHPSTTTAWIGVSSGNVLQIETAGKGAGKPAQMRVVYSDFNSPAIRIDPPK